MKIAYIDTSYLVAIAFSEPGYQKLIKRSADFDQCLSSNLLSAEFYATIKRESGNFVKAKLLLDGISWILPQRSLENEVQLILKNGYIRGADLWHLACAMYVSKPHQITFLTLDRHQKKLAELLGFIT